VSNCDDDGECDHVVEVEVQNIGNASSNPTNVLATMNNGLSGTGHVPPLPPLGSEFIYPFLGHGFNCLDLAACVTTAQVDPANMVIESNETNNTANRVD
jgi:subtilase family serine protease